jgi:hypothetical protein
MAALDAVAVLHFRGEVSDGESLAAREKKGARTSSSRPFQVSDCGLEASGNATPSP